MFAKVIIALFSFATVEKVIQQDWKLAGIYLCSAILNWLFII